VEVNFRLHPVEQHARTWTAVAPDKNAGFFAAPLRALLDSQMTASSVQLRSSKQQCCLDIRIAGVPVCLDEYDLRLQRFFGQSSLSQSDDIVWQGRRQLFDNSSALVLKVSLLPSDICATSAQLQQWAVADALDVNAVAHATGLMTVALNTASLAAPAFVERLRSRVIATGGSVVALQVPAALRGAIDVWGPEPGTLPLMREIKRRFDPRRILNPGRFVGNI
jgi:glycolate oxidase FAD binding subunit